MKNKQIVKQYFEEGNQLRKEGDLERAAQKYCEALQKNKNYIPALLKLGLIHEKQKRFDRALDYYQQVIQLRPNNSQFYTKLARTMNSKGNIQGAISAFQKAIELKSEQPSWVYAGFGNVLYHNGDREQAIVAYQKAREINSQILNITEKKVNIGKKEWLFLDNDSNQVNKQLSGEITFSDEELFQWKNLLEYRKKRLSNQGISYFFLIVPTKGCVYPEYLPNCIQLSDRRCVIQLIDYLSIHSEVKPIYPLLELIDAKAEMPVYSQRETHWNDFGAFIGYRTLLSEISRTHNVELLSQSSIDFSQHIFHSCDLGNKLGIKNNVSIKSKILQQNFQCIFNNKIQNTGKVVIYENQNKKLPKAILFRDSFSSQLLKLLAGSFSRLVAVWQPNIDYSIVRDENPDLVISQQAERFLVKIPDDLGGPTNQEIVQKKLNR